MRYYEFKTEFPLINHRHLIFQLEQTLRDFNKSNPEYGLYSYYTRELSPTNLTAERRHELFIKQNLIQKIPPEKLDCLYFIIKETEPEKIHDLGQAVILITLNPLQKNNSVVFNLYKSIIDIFPHKDNTKNKD